MTSNPPAQPRPPRTPSFANLVSQSPRRASYSLVDSGETFEDGAATIDLTDVDDRPPKRRKTDGQSQTLFEQTQTKDVPSILVSDDDDQAKQEKRYVSVQWTAAMTPVAQQPADEGDSTPSQPPLPMLPLSLDRPPEKLATRPRTSCRTRAEVPVPNKPDAIGVHDDVPQLEHKRPADYFPWMGKHPEDILNEVNVKSGYNDRAPNPPDKELNTARTSLQNALKNYSGLESLSALFQLLLERKVKTRTLSSSTSFKPPPRVTLTEAKRKSWISDLANVNVPLRRLSRTIPQGIRGQGLLDQCASGHVPLARAIWFIKCVGANEIRTLKRKGTTPNLAAGVELKWLREWTVNVEQFIESVLVQMGQPSWQQNIQYALRMCTRLFQDNLLERDHYLDWIVKGLSSGPTNQLAFWLMMVHLHRRDILRFRKRAKNLSQALISKFELLDTVRLVDDSALQHLSSTIRSLAASQPGAFIIPDAEEKVLTCLGICLGQKDPFESRLFEHIKARLARFSNADTSTDRRVNSETSIVALLDATRLSCDTSKLAATILKEAASVAVAINTCLDWAVSRFRASAGHVYLVTRLVRHWISVGHALEPELLAYFTAKHDFGRVSPSRFHHLFAEFVRSQLISPSRLLQHLSIRGIPKKKSLLGYPPLLNVVPADIEACDRLLIDVSVETLETHNLNLRNALLTRARYDVAAEVELKDQYLERLSQTVDNDGPLDQELLHALHASSWSIKFALSSWMRSQALVFAQYFDLELADKPPLPGMKVLTPSIFHIMRTILEELGDVTALVDVLQILSKTRQEVLLASLVDTIHVHADEIAAIGAFETLQNIYCQTYVALRSQRPSLIHFALSLLDLCRSFPNRTTPVRALEQDVIKGDRGRAAAAFSPFSDGVAESLQQAGETFVEDFEAILLVENNMADVTMTSLFTVLIARIMKGDSDTIPGQSTSDLCLLLARLSLLKRTQADVLVKKWLSRILSSPWSSSRAKILHELLRTRTIGFADIFEVTNTPSSHASCKVAICSLLASSVHARSDARDMHSYAVIIAGQRFKTQHTLETAEILLPKLDASGTCDDTTVSLLSGVLRLEERAGMLTKAITDVLVPSIDRLLDVQSTNLVNPVESTLRRLDLFSVAFCQYRLRHVIETGRGDGSGDSDHNIAQAILNFMLRQDPEDREPLKYLQPLLRTLTIPIKDKLREAVDHAFLDNLPKQLQNKSMGIITPLGEETKRQLADSAANVVALGASTSYNDSSVVVVSLVEKLAHVGKLLGAKPEINTTVQTNTGSSSTPLSATTPTVANSTTILIPGTDQRHGDISATVLEYLWILLKVTGTKCAVFANTCSGATVNNAKQRQNEQLKLVALITMIATQPALAQWQSTSEDEAVKHKISDTISFALDIAARLVDDMSDECRTMCARIMKDRMKDERVQWLLGSVNLLGSIQSAEAGRGLQIVHETRGNTSEFKPKYWDILESGGSKESDTCLGLGLFGAIRT